jgi:hypothetical protein
VNAAESDLRGEVALAIMAFLTWAEFHGGAGALLDGSVSRWLTVCRPADHGIARALTNTRRALVRYIAHGGQVPGWVPASLAEALREPQADGSSGVIANGSPSENPPTSKRQRCNTVAELPHPAPNNPSEADSI